MMRAFRAAWMRLTGSLCREHFENEFTAELESHLAMHTEDGIQAGLSPEEAARQAKIQLGGAEQTRQAYRERSIFPQLENLVQDIRYTLRQWHKSPGFAVAAVCTLALAIGANSSIFSLIDAVLRHPSGIDHPERVVVLKTSYARFNLDVADVSVPSYATAASMKDVVDRAAIQTSENFNTMRHGVMEHLSGAQVSKAWFQVFGAQPILGRTFSAEEDQPHAAPVTVLSYGLWQDRFGGSRDAIGKSIELDGKSYRVIGVMRSDFAWPRGVRLWTTMGLAPDAFSPDNMFNETYFAVVRLKPGVAVSQFSAQYLTRLRAKLFPGTGAKFAASAGWSVSGVTLSSIAAGTLRKSLLILMSVVVMILLIASANIAGLFLARASARSQEFAIRTALGAGIFRTSQQLCVETILLAGVAAVLGVVSGPALGRAFLFLLPQGLAEGYAVHSSPSLLAFTAGVSSLAAFIAGMGPSWKMVRQGRRLQLSENSRSATASREKQRMRSFFVIGQVALSFVLLACTGLFLASLRQLQHVAPGFDSENVLTATVSYAGNDFKTNKQQQAAFIRTSVDTVAAQSGVRAAAVYPLPFTDSGMSQSFGIVGHARAANDPGPHSQFSLATPDYLKVMRIPMLSGRWFTDGDRADTEPVAVVDDQLARKYWPQQNPVGQHISNSNAALPTLIVGVVRSIRSHSLEEENGEGMLYYPFSQVVSGQANFVTRIDTSPTTMAAVYRSAVQAAAPSQAVSSTGSLQTLVSDSLAGRQLITWMLSAFAALALLMTVIGLYGLISYVTGERVGEIGVRMALGAQRKDVVKLLLTDVLQWMASGLFVGVVLSVCATIFLRHTFSIIGAGVVLSLAASGLVLLVVAAIACIAPAQRAASVDPVGALRAQ